MSRTEGREMCSLRWLSLSRVALAIGIGVTGGGNAHAQVCDPAEIDKLLADDGKVWHGFGNAVSLDGETAVVGAEQNYDHAEGAGAAYVFTRVGGEWIQEAKFLPEDLDEYDRFGWQVSVSGDTAVVGVPYDDDRGESSGSAYVFTRVGGVWTQGTKLLLDDGGGFHFFGTSVCIQDDTIVIGAAGDDDNGERSGSAVVFTRSGDVWIRRAKLLPDDGDPEDRFGSSIDIDGDTVVIGASEDEENGDKSGSVYVFTRSGDTWNQQAKLLPVDGVADDLFGCSVSVSGDTVVVGAISKRFSNRPGSAYVFMRSGEMWAEQAKLQPGDVEANDLFGRSVSIDGDAAIVGAMWDEDNGDLSGSAYVFTRSDGAWIQQAKLPDDGSARGRFGASVSLCGNTALVGAKLDQGFGSRTGSAYVFDLGCTDCPADLNHDAVVDTQDFLVFLNAWAAHDPLADWDRNDIIDTRDFIAYLNDWVAGCP